MTRTEFKRNLSDAKTLFSEEKAVLKKILREVMQEVLEKEMTDSLGAAKRERSLNRRGYRPGYYERSQITRVGKHFPCSDINRLWFAWKARHALSFSLYLRPSDFSGRPKGQNLNPTFSNRMKSCLETG
jgi:hypothetical protein